MSAGQRLSATTEDYLEAILKLEREKRAARVKDISAELSVHKSTVSSALRHMADKGLVVYSPYELTTLTPEGRRIAEAVTKSHGIIKKFLTRVLGVDEARAAENACRMEHAVDDQVLRRLVLLARFAEEDERDLPARFAKYVKRSSPE
jgi:DtxR family Mn-dependent transcriptional regulator